MVESVRVLRERREVMNLTIIKIPLDFLVRMRVSIISD